MVHPYFVEDFSEDERRILARHFTNTDKPVFALKNLPEAVKGALFARYSRSAKSLRRLFLDEFYRGEEVTELPDVGRNRASELYDRIFIEFGDDSVAQLGGAHIAVEQGSNVLTKALEWGRLGAYLEQSTRYVAYDDTPGGRFRYYLEPEIMASPHGPVFRREMDRMFTLYSQALPIAIDGYRTRFPKTEKDTEGVYRATIRAKALDALRGMLPAGTVSNTGIYASGQAYETMLLRMRGSPLAEVRDVAGAILRELEEIIGVFLQRVGQPERGGAWTEYLAVTREATERLASELAGDLEPEPVPAVRLVEWDPEGEDKVLAAMLYATTDLPEHQLAGLVKRLGAGDRARLVGAYCGDRRNRRHRPGRALERTGYTFDVLADYGAFRDLQRHRMLTVQWQDLTCRHGYEIPPDLDDLGAGGAFREAMDASAAAWEDIHPHFPKQAQYAVGMAYRVRFSLQMNAREAMHVVELRSSPQGHRSYRAIAQEMHRLIAEVAGHKAVAKMMSFVDYSDVDLERLEAERRAERKRRALAGGAG